MKELYKEVKLKSTDRASELKVESYDGDIAFNFKPVNKLKVIWKILSDRPLDFVVPANQDRLEVHVYDRKDS